MRPATRDSGCSACCSIVSPFDVPLQLVVFVSRLLAGRREVGTRRRTRALTCIRQAVFTLAWFWDRPGIRMLGARSADLAARTAYSASKAALLNVTKSLAICPDQSASGSTRSRRSGLTPSCQPIPPPPPVT
jgi:hypothetical protein